MLRCSSKREWLVVIVFNRALPSAVSSDVFAVEPLYKGHINWNLGNPPLLRGEATKVSVSFEGLRTIVV